MKVWVVRYENCSDCCEGCIESVFDTEKKANDFIRLAIKTKKDSKEVCEIDSFNMSEFEVK
jgi:translation initiation factor 1 (eIF-1/SUI1)